MIFAFDSNIFTDLSEDKIYLLDKIWINSLGRHELFIANKDDLDTILESDWGKGIRQSSNDYLKKSFKSSVYINKKNIKLLISEHNENYSLLEAEDILNKPFGIILENIEYDKYFLDALIKCFPNESKKIKIHIDNGWLNFINGGGNNITNVLNEAKVRYNRPEFPKESKFYLRNFILIDSDKKFPSDKEVADDKVILLDEIKQSLGDSYHVLKKREMENYLPDITMQNIKNNDEYISAYLNLNETQKDHFDIQNGLPDKNIDQLTPAELKNLYSDIVNPSLNTFRKKKLELKNEELVKISFKANFPKYFNHESVTKDSLKKRANSDELEQLLNKIVSLL